MKQIKIAAAIMAMIILNACQKNDEDVMRPELPSSPGEVYYVPARISKNLILLKFNGYSNHGPSGLSSTQQDSILQAVRAAYASFNLEITVDENQNYWRRQIVVFTTDNEWYSSSVGGVSNIGSFKTGEPSYVFTKPIKFSTDRAIYTSIHEIGHTLGLSHQMQYSASCQNLGYTQDVWMGFVPNGHTGHWTAGTPENFCGLGYIQNDSLQIINYLK